MITYIILYYIITYIYDTSYLYMKYKKYHSIVGGIYDTSYVYMKYKNYHSIVGGETLLIQSFAIDISRVQTSIMYVVYMYTYFY